MSDRASTLRDVILNWRYTQVTPDERETVTRKVLGLHVALSRLAPGVPK